MNDKLLIEKVYKDTILPIRTTQGSSGMDLFVYGISNAYTYILDTKNNNSFIEINVDFMGKIQDSYTLKPFDRILVDTGIRATVGKGYEIQIRSRSGLALKNGLRVENSPGTIDEDYRGIIKVIIINDSLVDRKIKKGDRIAQLVIQKVEILDMDIVDKLPESVTRGEGGFGHTGV